MAVSLRQQLETLFPNQPIKVKELCNHYAKLVEVNPSWRIGGFISIVKGAMNNE